MNLPISTMRNYVRDVDEVQVLNISLSTTEISTIQIVNIRPASAFQKSVSINIVQLIEYNLFNEKKKQHCQADTYWKQYSSYLVKYFSSSWHFFALFDSLPEDKWAGNCGWHFTMDSSSTKGISPQTRSYNKIPNDQTVCGKPKYRRHVTHSGGA